MLCHRKIYLCSCFSPPLYIYIFFLNSFYECLRLWRPEITVSQFLFCFCCCSREELDSKTRADNVTDQAEHLRSLTEYCRHRQKHHHYQLWLRRQREEQHERKHERKTQQQQFHSSNAYCYYYYDFRVQHPFRRTSPAVTSPDTILPVGRFTQNGGVPLPRNDSFL